MAKVQDVLTNIEKSCGPNIAKLGEIKFVGGRIPTGVFPFDLATGGGFPEGRICILYGHESSLKTTLALMACASYQRMHPDKVCVIIDIEGHYDASWAKKLGVDIERMVHVCPDYGEQAVDIAEQMLYAEDVGVVVFDSLAALIPAKEVEDSADKAQVGVHGLLIGKLYRKATLALSKARKYGHCPTFLAINQIRYKIGVMFGDPEIMPGGQPFKFASAMTVRLYGKDEMDKKVHDHLPAYKKVTGQIKKIKVPIVSRNFEFKFPTVGNKANGVKVADVDDWNLILSYMVNLGKLGKIEGTNKWHLYGEEFATQKAIREYLYSDPNRIQSVRTDIIEAILKEHSLDDDDLEVVNDH